MEEAKSEKKIGINLGKKKLKSLSDDEIDVSLVKAIQAHKEIIYELYEGNGKLGDKLKAFEAYTNLLFKFKQHNTLKKEQTKKTSVAELVKDKATKA